MPIKSRHFASTCCCVVNATMIAGRGVYMDVLARLRQLMDEKGLNDYRLAKAAGLHQSTISKPFKNNTIPTVPILEAICKALNITMSQFFAEDNLIELTKEQKEMFDQWAMLSPEQKQVLMELIKVMK